MKKKKKLSATRISGSAVIKPPPKNYVFTICASEVVPLDLEHFFLSEYNWSIRSVYDAYE
jgi:hypothetical protein